MDQKEGVRKLEVQLDSMVIINTLNQGTQHMGNCATLLHIIRNVDRFKEIHIVHIFLWENQCADSLAKMSCNNRINVFYFDHCP